MFYFTSRFPRLLIHTYHAVKCCMNEPVFQQYYDTDSLTDSHSQNHWCLIDHVGESCDIIMWGVTWHYHVLANFELPYNQSGDKEFLKGITFTCFYNTFPDLKIGGVMWYDHVCMLNHVISAILQSFIVDIVSNNANKFNSEMFFILMTCFYKFCVLI